MSARMQTGNNADTLRTQEHTGELRSQKSTMDQTEGTRACNKCCEYASSSQKVTVPAERYQQIIDVSYHGKGIRRFIHTSMFDAGLVGSVVRRKIGGIIITRCVLRGTLPDILQFCERLRSYLNDRAPPTATLKAHSLEPLSTSIDTSKSTMQSTGTHCLFFICKVSSAHVSTPLTPPTICNSQHGAPAPHPAPIMGVYHA